MFLKELMLIKQVHQKSVISLLLFLKQGFKLQPYVYNKFHDLLMMSMNLRDIAILKIKCTDYRCIITGISKSEAIKLLQDFDLTEKKWNIVKPNTKSNSEAVNLLQILI